MKNRTIKAIKNTVLSLGLLTLSSVALAGANPNPVSEHFVGPFLWGVDPVQCEELGPDTVIVESYIEELWGHHLGNFNQGFADANGGWHLVQPAHWIMSANSLDGELTWLGRVAAHAQWNFPGETNGGQFSYLANAILRADGDWPDLKVRLFVRIAADANGNLRVFDDRIEYTCHP